MSSPPTVSGFDSGGHTTITQRGTGTTIITGDVRTLYTYVNQGTLIVDGAGASIHDSPSGVTVGQNSGDDGYLTVRNGGNISFIGGLGSTANGYVGRNAGATGSALVTGTGSTLRGGYLALGLYGNGVLTLADGGALILREAGLLSLGGHEGGVGTLNIGAYDLAHPTAAGTLDVGSVSFGDGVGDIYFNQTDAFTVAAAITRTVTADAQAYPVKVTQRGTGTTTLAGTNTYAGATNVRGGTLKITGSIAHPDFNLTVGLDSGETASVVIDANAAATDQHGVLGWQAGATGTASVNTGATWTNLGELRVGERGVGTLTINNGTVTSGGDSSIGLFSGATGTVTMNGGALTATGEVRVGDAGAGTLVLNDGVITGSLANIARSLGSTGTVTMNGGTWNNTAGLFVVGNTGAGTFVQTGGTVNTVTGELARGAAGTGVATVSGGLWHNTGNLYIGQAGNGTLTLAGDGVVQADSAVYIANAAGATGTLNFGAHDLAQATTAGTLDTAGIAFGAGTGLINFNQTGALTLAAGISGNGKLVQRGTGTTVLTGANTLDTGGEYDGVTTIKQGTLAVDGAAARLAQTAGALFVGELNGDNGAFIVRNGAQASDTRGYVGLRAGATGVATVTGTNSLWSHASDLAVGYEGQGSLDLADGGKVTNGGSYLGYAAGASGSATVTGGGSLWQNSGDIAVGDSGIGSLTVSVGGKVTNANAYIGKTTTGSSGVVLVTGAGSSWESSGELHVGSHGTGTLTIADGAQVSDDYGIIGRYAGASGAVTVTGAGSRWTNASPIEVGQEGAGTLLVAAGGAAVSENSVYVAGFGAGATGSVVVTGAGSSLAADLNLRIGHTGTGEVTLADGAALTVGRDVYLGNAAGSSGTLNIGAHDLAQATTGGTLSVSGTGGVRAFILGANGGTGTLNFNQTDDFTLNAPITGHGTVNQRGTGVTTLTGANTYTGETNITDGTLKLADDASLTGTDRIRLASGTTFDVSALTGGFILGAGQTLSGGGTIIGNLAFDAAATVHFDLGGYDLDALAVGGDLAYASALTLSLTNGFTPMAGDTFHLFDVTGTSSGAFDRIVFSDATLTGAFDYGTGTLTIAAVPEPSTYALIVGAIVLGLAAWRRRRA